MVTVTFCGGKLDMEYYIQTESGEWFLFSCNDHQHIERADISCRSGRDGYSRIPRLCISCARKAGLEW